MTTPTPSAQPSVSGLARRRLLTLAALALAGGTTGPAAAAGLRHGNPILDIPFFNVHGQAHVLAQWLGRPMLVNFYATWCAPCREEMPSMDALAALRPHLAVLPISVERGGTAPLRRFYATLGLRHMGIYQDGTGRLAQAAGVWSYPTTLLLDAGGIERGRVTSALDWSSPAVLAHLDTLIAAAPRGWRAAAPMAP